MSDLAFCPRCGIGRTGPTCANCGFDYLAPVKTPTITLSRGINWISLAWGVLVLAIVAFVVSSVVAR